MATLPFLSRQRTLRSLASSSVAFEKESGQSWQKEPTTATKKSAGLDER
jgi:hypothetical protein